MVFGEDGPMCNVGLWKIYLEILSFCKYLRPPALALMNDSETLVMEGERKIENKGSENK